MNMLPNVHLNADENLDDKTIVASLSTCHKLRDMLGSSEFLVVHDTNHSDDVITVGPELYDAFNYYLEYLDKRDSQTLCS